MLALVQNVCGSRMTWPSESYDFLLILDRFCRGLLRTSPVHATTMISPSTILSCGSIVGLWMDSEAHFTGHDTCSMVQNHHFCTIFITRNSIWLQIRLWYVLVVVQDDLKKLWAAGFLLMSRWYPIIPLKLTGRGHAEKAIDNGYGVDMSMFLSEKMMPPCQPNPTKCLLTFDALWNSHRRLCTWEFTKISLWRIDWIVVLPMLLVMSCWWSYGHLPTDKRRIKHSEQ